MKKWLNILGTITFTTVSTTAIVACKTSESILSKSFASSYNVDDFSNLEGFGIKYNEENNTYDFVWSKLTVDLATIIVPINNTVPVQKISKDKNIKVKENELVAIYFAEDQQGLIIGSENFITIKIKLNLYKGVKEETNKVELVDQTVEYDVSLNLFVKQNLKFLTTPTVNCKTDIVEFKTILVKELKKQNGFSKLDINMINIVKVDGDPLTTEDLKEHDTHVKITLTDEGKNNFIGENNDLKVNWVPEV